MQSESSRQFLDISMNGLVVSGLGSLCANTHADRRVSERSGFPI